MEPKHTLPGLRNISTGHHAETRPERDARYDAKDQAARTRSRTDLDRLIEDRELRKLLREMEL